MKLYKFENLISDETAKGKTVAKFHNSEYYSALIVEYTDNTFSVFVAEDSLLCEGTVIENEINDVNHFIKDAIVKFLPNQKYSEV